MHSQDLSIVFENSDFLVVNKSAGLIAEKSPYEHLNVENQVEDYLSSNRKKPFVGVVHRLDRVTSGALIFAKKKSVLVGLNDLFSKRKVQKTYLAIVRNKPVQSHGVLSNFLVKNQKEKRAYITTENSKEALRATLSYRILSENNYGYLLEVRPKTGRFHQIRAQLSHMGSPIIGDEKYGSQQPYKSLCIGLHAWKIQFQDPVSKEPQSHTASLPNTPQWDFPM